MSILLLQNGPDTLQLGNTTDQLLLNNVDVISNVISLKWNVLQAVNQQKIFLWNVLKTNSQADFINIELFSDRNVKADLTSNRIIKATLTRG